MKLNKTLFETKKFRFIKAEDIFNKNEAITGMTLEKFKERRVNDHVPIEDIILKERYK